MAELAWYSEAINQAFTALRGELQAEFQTKLDSVPHELHDVRECSAWLCLALAASDAAAAVAQPAAVALAALFPFCN